MLWLAPHRDLAGPSRDPAARPRAASPLHRSAPLTHPCHYGAGAHRYQHSLENLERATQGRRERAARDAVREEMERQQYSETQERRARMRGRDERAKEEWVRSNLSRGREMRDFSAMCREAIAEQRRQLHEQTKVKVGPLRLALSARELRANAHMQHHMQRRMQRRMQRHECVQGCRMLAGRLAQSCLATERCPCVQYAHV